MNKYAVAVLDFYQNINKVYIVQGENEVEAILRAITEYYNYDDGDMADDTIEEISKWIEDMKHLTVEGIIDECFEGDLAVSEPIKIKMEGEFNETI